MKKIVKQKFFVCLIFGVSLLVNGCAKTIFFWGDYEDSLYERYVENDHRQAYLQLSKTIQEAESRNLRVAPGIYADYGFVLFQRGETSGAIQYFLKEKQTYPESTALMNKLISKIEEKQKKQDAKTDTPPMNQEGNK